MTYVVTENCIKCKYMECIEVCPVDCFYEGEHMVVIHPGQCIDCGICEPECPASAIKSISVPELQQWAQLNATFSAVWPHITQRKQPASDADEWLDVAGKYEIAFPHRPKVAPNGD